MDILDTNVHLSRDEKSAFNFGNKNIRYSYMTSQSIKPRNMTAKEFNLEKKRWNKLKAKESLEKLKKRKTK